MIQMTKITKSDDAGNLLEGLPILVDDTSLAFHLDLSGKNMWGLLKAATREDAGSEGSLYKKITIPKKSGKVRVLYAPEGSLKAVQTKIRDRILDKAPKSPISVAYRSGMCPGDTAKVIAGAPVIIQLDIKDYFPSILQSQVRDYFKSLGYGDYVSNLLGGLLCVKDGKRRFVPQGGTASPMLANRIAEMIIDPAVESELPEGWRYLRYCDNLYIWPVTQEAYRSIKHKDLLNNIRKSISLTGFSTHKGSIVPYYRRQKLLGLTVNVKANMPRERYKLLRACLYNCSKLGIESQLTSSAALGFEALGDTRADVLRFKAFLSGMLNYYKDYITQHKYQQLVNWYSVATGETRNEAD